MKRGEAEANQEEVRGRGGQYSDNRERRRRGYTRKRGARGGQYGDNRERKERGGGRGGGGGGGKGRGGGGREGGEGEGAGGADGQNQRTTLRGSGINIFYVPDAIYVLK